MRSSSHDRMISYSQLLVDLQMPKKTLPNKSWVMEQLTLLQNQFPVEEVKIDIMIKFKLCIYNIYIHIKHAYCDYKKIVETLVTSFYEIFGDEQRLLIVNSVDWTFFPMLTENRTILKNLYTHNILFWKAKKNINNYGTFAMRYYYVL